MTTGDLRVAAGLHSAHLSDGFFVSLGPRFLRAYLATFLDSGVSVALVAELGDRTVGFLVGSFDHRAHVSMTVRRHGARLAVLGLLAMLARPAVGWRFLRTRARRYLAGLFRTRFRRSIAETTKIGPAGGLGHIVVTPEARGARIGSSLVEEYLRRVRAYGVSRAQLSTRAGSAGAGPFYEGLAWKRAATSADADGVRWTQYYIEV